MCCSRHHQEQLHADNAETYPLDVAKNCVCPGDSGYGCCGAWTSAEDKLCDRCRNHCKPTQENKSIQEKETVNVGA